MLSIRPQGGLWLALALLYGQQGEAAPLRPTSIEFEGLLRVEQAALRALIRGTLAPEDLQADLRALFNTGYFEDIRVYRKRDGPNGPQLVYVLSEKPAISKVRLRGVEALDEDDLRALIDLKPFTLLSQAKVQDCSERLLAHYKSEGFARAKVEVKLEPQANNRVQVVFQITETSKVEVKKISFFGNEQLKEARLRSAILTQEGSLLSLLTQRSLYREEELKNDVLRLNALYLEEGFIHVKVHPPKVEFTPDGKKLSIRFGVEEGPRFRLGKIRFSQNEALLQSLKLKEGEIFRRSALSQALLRLKTFYEDRGFANANITPMTRVDEDNKRIDIEFVLERGGEVRYERINVTGNTKTRDRVIRQELSLHEGELTSATGRARSKAKVQALGFFESVELKTRPGSKPSLQILDVEVKEKDTGTVNGGLGFSPGEGPIGQANFAWDNFLGWGNALAISAQVSKARQVYQLKYFERRLFGTKWQFSFDLFRSDTRFQNFFRLTDGFRVGLGYALTNALTLSLGYNLEFVRSRVSGGGLQPAYQPINNSGRISSLQLTAGYDTRNNRVAPTRGMFHQITAEVSDRWLGASATRAFLKVSGQARFYYPLPWGIVARGSVRAGYMRSLSDQALSPSEKFVLGGINSIRGYSPLSIGPERRATRNDRGLDALSPYSTTYVFNEGGNKQFLANLELEFPILEEFGVRGVLFADAGNVYGEDENLFYVGGRGRAPVRSRDDPTRFDTRSLPLGMYWSAGFGVRWFTPMGPLRFEWGIPLTRRPGDPKGPRFEFSIGTSF